MKIISISGLDGSGKSTQIELLQKYLESQGKKVMYFHAVQFSLPQAVRAFFKKHCLICKLLGKCKVNSKPKQEKSVSNANWLQIQLRKIVLPIDLWRFKKFLKKLEKQGYDYLVSDRYFYDNIINISYLSQSTPLWKRGVRGDLKDGNISENVSNPSSILPFPKGEGFIPHPDHAFYLKTDPKTIMLRDRVPDQGMEYLETKQKLFDKFAPIFDLKIINGNRIKEEIFNNIKSQLHV